MLKTLYETFATLYSEIVSNNPTLASEHALAQEQEVYSGSTKLTYRNVSIPSFDRERQNEKYSPGHDILRRRSEETSQTNVHLA